MGTRSKDWIEDDDGSVWLLKYPLKSRMEIWSEKSAHELACLIGLPCADYELGRRDSNDCILSRCFTSAKSPFIPANELLGIPKGMVTARRRRESKTMHTIEKILPLLSSIRPPAGFQHNTAITSGEHVFLGYLIFDAWICNVDRHEQNWGWLFVPYEKGLNVHLAPSFDHGSCLGRELNDVERLEKLNDNIQFNAYIRRAQSKIYGADGRRLKLLQTVEQFMQACPKAGTFWIDRIGGLDEEMIVNVFDQFPDEFRSPLSGQFALRILKETKVALLSIRSKYQ
jgi:hypothetical protein